MKINKFHPLFRAQIGYVTESSGRRTFRMHVFEPGGTEAVDFNPENAKQMLAHYVDEAIAHMYPKPEPVKAEPESNQRPGLLCRVGWHTFVEEGTSPMGTLFRLKCKKCGYVEYD